RGRAARTWLCVCATGGGSAPRRGKIYYFSSRRRHPILKCDWSSDVCSADLWRQQGILGVGNTVCVCQCVCVCVKVDKSTCRSGERRVGRECRSRWSTDH